MNKQLGIGFGVLCEPISVQLANQGFKFNKDKVQQFEKLCEAINVLRFGDITSDSVTDKITQKLYNKIEAHIRKENGLIKAAK